MPIYHLRSFAATGRVVAVQRLSAENDKEALSMARDMVKRASAVARFDVWQGERRIEGAAPTMRKGKPRRTDTAAEMTKQLAKRLPATSSIRRTARRARRVVRNHDGE